MWAQQQASVPPPFPQIPFAEPIHRPPPPKSSSKKWLTGIAVCAILACAIIAGVVKSYRDTHPDLPGRAFESKEQKRLDTTSAFALGPAQPIDLPPQDLASLQAFFARLSKAGRNSDATAISSCIDYDRMLGEMAAGGDPDLAEIRRDPAALAGFERGFKSSLGQLNTVFSFNSCDIRQVRSWPGAPDEVVVYVALSNGSGPKERMRWWLRRQGTSWRIWDFEDVRFGLRISHVMTAVVSSGSLRDPRVQQRLQQASANLRAGRVAILNGDFAGAQTSLKNAADPALPPTLESLRLVSLAICSVHNGKHDEGLSLADQASQQFADLPLIDLVRSEARLGLGKSDEALADINHYEAAVGPDSLSGSVRGRIHLAKFKREEAAKAFRDGLQDDPTSDECFAGLCKAVGIAGIAELRTHFAKLSNRLTVLAAISNDSIRNHNISALDAAVTLYREAGVLNTDAMACFAEAELYVLRQDWKQAAATFEAHIDLLRSSPVTRGAVDEEYAVCLIESDQVLKGYRLHPDKAVAIELAGDYLVNRNKSEPLDALVKEHRASHADDVLHLAFLEGSTAEIREQYDAAEKHFRLALDRAVTDEWRGRVSKALVRILFHQDRIEEAFNTIGPQKDTISTLAGLAHVNQKPQVLRKIADLLQAQNASNPLASWYRADAAWLDKDFAACGGILRSCHQKFPENEWPGMIIPDRAIRCLVRSGKAAEALSVAQEMEQSGRKIEYLYALAAAAANAPDAASRLDRLMADSAADDEEDRLTLAGLKTDEDFAKALASPQLAGWMKRRQAAEFGAVYPSLSTSTRPATKPSQSP